MSREYFRNWRLYAEVAVGAFIGCALWDLLSTLWRLVRAR